MREKLQAYADHERSRSKRRNDLPGIARRLEAHPNLGALVPADGRAKLKD